MKKKHQAEIAEFHEKRATRLALFINGMGWTLGFVAEKCEVTRPTVSRWLEGFPIRDRHLLSLAKMGVPNSVLYRGIKE